MGALVVSGVITTRQIYQDTGSVLSRRFQPPNGSPKQEYAVQVYPFFKSSWRDSVLSNRSLMEPTLVRSGMNEGWIYIPWF